jgi:hypothetical protein
MAEFEGEAEVSTKKGGKGKILALVAVVGAAIAALMFWRSRRSSDDLEEDEEL